MIFPEATYTREGTVKFLRFVFKGKEITDTENSAGLLIDLIEDDVVRISSEGDEILNISEGENYNGSNIQKDAIGEATEFLLR